MQVTSGGGAEPDWQARLPAPPPVLLSIAPGSASAGGGAFTLTVRGTGFQPTSTVRWNGVDRPTAFVSPQELTAQIAAADVAGPGTAEVSVATGPPGGGVSAARPFTVTARGPAGTAPPLAASPPVVTGNRRGGQRALVLAGRVGRRGLAHLAVAARRRADRRRHQHHVRAHARRRRPGGRLPGHRQQRRRRELLGERRRRPGRGRAAARQGRRRAPSRPPGRGSPRRASPPRCRAPLRTRAAVRAPARMRAGRLLAVRLTFNRALARERVALQMLRNGRYRTVLTRRVTGRRTRLAVRLLTAGELHLPDRGPRRRPAAPGQALQGPREPLSDAGRGGVAPAEVRCYHCACNYRPPIEERP